MTDKPNINNMDPELNLSTKIFGKSFYYYNSISSTNTKALQLAKEGAEEGSVVCAGFQTSGKGSRSNNWQSNADENMLISLICRPKKEIKSALKITLASALILRESILTYQPIQKLLTNDITLKWPNDLIINKKKLAGILVESSLKGNRIDSMIIGFGLNLNTQVSMMDYSIQKKAVSIIDLINKKTYIWDFISHFLFIFEKRYFSLLANDFMGLLDEWKINCAHKEELTIQIPRNKEKGYFHDLDKDGFLLYRTDSGKIKKLINGQILY